MNLTSRGGWKDHLTYRMCFWGGAIGASFFLPLVSCTTPGQFETHEEAAAVADTHRVAIRRVGSLTSDFKSLYRDDDLREKYSTKVSALIAETVINSIRVYRREESFEDTSITSRRIYHNPIYEGPVKTSGGWHVVGGGYQVGEINGMRLKVTRARCTLQGQPFNIYIYTFGNGDNFPEYWLECQILEPERAIGEAIDKFNKAEQAGAGKPDPAAS